MMAQESSWIKRGGKEDLSYLPASHFLTHHAGMEMNTISKVSNTGKTLQLCILMKHKVLNGLQMLTGF